MNPLEYGYTLDGSMFRAIETDDPIAPNSIVYLISCKGNCPTKDCHLTKEVWLATSFAIVQINLKT